MRSSNHLKCAKKCQLALFSSAIFISLLTSLLMGVFIPFFCSYNEVRVRRDTQLRSGPWRPLQLSSRSIWPLRHWYPGLHFFLYACLPTTEVSSFSLMMVCMLLMLVVVTKNASSAIFSSSLSSNEIQDFGLFFVYGIFRRK